MALRLKDIENFFYYRRRLLFFKNSTVASKRKYLKQQFYTRAAFARRWQNSLVKKTFKKKM